MYISKLILFAALILAVAGGFLLFQLGTLQQSEGTPQQQEQETRTPLEILLEGDGTEKAVLEPVDGSAGFVLAYRVIQDGVLLHAVVGRMDDPAEGTVYEGWLVQPEPLRFLSTGVLELNERGEWVAEGRLEGDYSSYTRYIVTEETQVDDTPERHVLEGDFF